MINTAPKSTEANGQPTWKERMAVALARDIVDGERIISGAHTEISFAAAMTASKETSGAGSRSNTSLPGIAGCPG